MKNRTKGLIFVTLAPALWGCSATVVQYLFAKGISAEWLVNVRLVFAGLFILGYAFLSKGKQTFAVWKNRQSAVHQLIFSIFGMLAIQLTYFMAIAQSNSATATVLQFTNAVMISVVLAIRYRTWPRRVELISLIMAVVGVVLLVTSGNFTRLNVSPAGLIWGLLSAVAAVSYTLVPTKLIHEFGALPVVGWAMLIGGIAYNFYLPMWNGVPKLTPFLILVILVVILFGTMIPYLLFLQGLSYVNPATASMLGAMEPLSAAVLTVTVLHTPLGLAEVLGMILVLGTVFIQSMDQPHILESGRFSRIFRKHHHRKIQADSKKKISENSEENR